MNLFTIFLIFLCVNLGLYMTLKFSKFLPFPLALICGIITGIFLVVIFCCVMDGIFWILRRLLPELPICRQCNSEELDYKFIEKTKRGRLVECKCGARYINSGRRFLEYSVDGQLKPYMKLTWFWRWRRDNSSD